VTDSPACLGALLVTLGMVLPISCAGHTASTPDRLSPSSLAIRLRLVEADWGGQEQRLMVQAEYRNHSARTIYLDPEGLRKTVWDDKGKEVGQIPLSVPVAVRPYQLLAIKPGKAYVSQANLAARYWKGLPGRKYTVQYAYCGPSQMCPPEVPAWRIPAKSNVLVLERPADQVTPELCRCHGYGVLAVCAKCGKAPTMKHKGTRPSRYIYVSMDCDCWDDRQVFMICKESVWPKAAADHERMKTVWCPKCGGRHLPEKTRAAIARKIGPVGDRK